jgi:flagellar hook-associated protein 3 FlgL
MSLRITPKTAQRLATTALDANLNRMSKLQEQLASGKLLNRASDSPTGVISAMQYRSEVRRNEQFERNANDGLNWLGMADETLTGMLDQAGRVRELMVRGMNASMGPTERANIAAEVETIADTLVGFANTKYLDRPIFGGNSDVDFAYAPDGTFAGSGGDAIERRVGPDMKVRVNVTGPEVFGPDGTGTQGNLFQLVRKIADDLRNGGGLDADLGALDDRVVNLQSELGTVGARYHQVDGMRDRAEQAQITVKNGLAEVESTDLPKTIVDLQLQEIAYQSALSATARVIQPSLLDFLR